MDHSFWDILLSFVLEILSILNELVLTILKVMGQQNEIWVFKKKTFEKISSWRRGFYSTVLYHAKFATHE